jgi:hypothetical protein
MKGKYNTRKVVILTLITLLTLLGGTASIGSAASSAQDTAVAVTITPTQITWTPLVENGGISLAISGPGFHLQEEYGANARLTLTSTDEAGNPIPDGLYRYEIQLSPVDEGAQPDVADAERGLVDPSNEEAKAYSGAFTVSGGYFVVPAEDETAGIDAARSRPGLDTATADILHYDDVIITGSLCVGFDCHDGESFGFDTIILKEHNLRIYFNDTSYTASYPTNNWRITINDSTNGGASYFSVDDADDGTSIFKLEAGAPSNSLYVDDYGRVGLGTSTPVVEAHIKDSDTPTVRLEQDSSGGWTAQTWDVAGNESNFFVRDATNGSKLPFRIQPNAPSSSLTIKNTGNVGIGTWSPEGALEIERTGENAKLVLQRTDGDKWVFNSASGGLRIAANDPATAQVLIETDGDMTIQGSLTEASDVNVKKNFVAVDGRQVLAAVVEMPITTWSFKADDTSARHIGPTAQDFHAAYGLGVDDKHIAPKDVAGVALAAIQGLNEVVSEQDAQIKALEERNANMQAQNRALEKRLAALERAVGSGTTPVTSLLIVLPWLVTGILLGAGIPTILHLRRRRP